MWVEEREGKEGRGEGKDIGKRRGEKEGRGGKRRRGKRERVKGEGTESREGKKKCFWFKKYIS